MFLLPLQEKVGRMGSFFCRRPPLLPVHLPKTREAAESRPSPAWGIHKVQQNEDKTLPAALSKLRYGLKWGNVGQVVHAAPVLYGMQRLSLQCHLSSAAHIGIYRQT